MRCLERALKAAAVAVPSTDAEEVLKLLLVEIWGKTWARCEEMGIVVVQRSTGECDRAARGSACAFHGGESGRVCGYYQVCEEYCISRALDGAEWPLECISTLACRCVDLS